MPLGRSYSCFKAESNYKSAPFSMITLPFSSYALSSLPLSPKKHITVRLRTGSTEYSEQHRRGVGANNEKVLPPSSSSSSRPMLWVRDGKWKGGGGTLQWKGTGKELARGRGRKGEEGRMRERRKPKSSNKRGFPGGS